MSATWGTHTTDTLFAQIKEVGGKLFGAYIIIVFCALFVKYVLRFKRNRTLLDRRGVCGNRQHSI